MAMVVLPEPPFGFSTTIRCIALPVAFTRIMSLRRLRMRDVLRKRCTAAALLSQAVRSCEAPHGGFAAPQPRIARNEKRSHHLEVFLRLWDEMDDWLMACRQVLRR